MSEVLFESNGITSLGSVGGAEDLKPRPGLNINPPPEDGRCYGCGRHLSQLKPFGKAGDPLVGDFNGAFLVKTFRPDFPPDEETDRIMEEFFGACSSEEDWNKAEWMLIERYGQEEAIGIMVYHQASQQFGSSWECRDCIRLSNRRLHRIQRNVYWGEP
jgi:hypothetical protein